MKNYFDFENLELVDCFITETELIKELCISKRDGSININLFSNLIHKPLQPDDFAKYTGFQISINVLREKLGFDKHAKPGDFDILIIPQTGEKLLFDRTCAIEVKIVRPTRKNPKKSPNANGISQVQGLIRDGFPLVGLIHICMAEPLRQDEKQLVPFDTATFDLDNPKNNNHFMQNTKEIKVDLFSMYSAENQMKRLITKEIPKYVGLCTVGINYSSKGELIMYTSLDFNTRFGSGYFNPHMKAETIEKVKRFWEGNQGIFLKATV